MNQEKITYEIKQAGHGLDTIVVKSGGRDIPLHSGVNPERDSELLRDKLDPSRHDFLVILGVGLGYHCLPLKNCIDRYRRIILVDILDGIEGAIARNRLTSFLLTNSRITLVAGKTTTEVERIVAEQMDMDSIRGIQVVEHPASMRLFNDYYGAVKKSINKVINIKAGNKATRQAFGSRYLRNILLNLAMVKRTRPVRHLFNALAGYPAIIAGSGPSLDEDMGMIARHQDRFFILSVDSALPALQGNGIYPDIVISIDPQPYVFEHFQNCQYGGFLSVSSLSAHPSLINRLPGYLSLNSHPFSQMAAEVYGDSIGSIDSGTGSVAGDAVSLAVKCGFSHIGLTGLDFSFSRFAIYARGTAYQKRYSTFFQNRFSTVEGLNLKYILNSSGGIKEAGKFTRKSFLQYHQTLDDYIRDNALTQIVALNERGIGLSGTVPASMTDFIGRWCSTSIDKKEVIGAVHGASRMIDAAPLIAAIGHIVDEKIFNDLLESSLGVQVNDKMKNYYRNLVLMARRSFDGT